MHDYQFEILQIKAAITPQAEMWPADDSEVSIMGDKPTVKGGALHWSALHQAVADARNCTTKALAQMSAVDSDQSLSAAGKAEQKQKIAKAALAEHEKSKSLSRAQSAVEAQVRKWNEELGLTPKFPTDFATSMIHAELRACVAAQKSGDRMAFILNNISDVAPALLNAPPLLCGLSKADLSVVRERIAELSNPALAKTKADTLQALSDAEKGWRAAVRQISGRAGGLGETAGNGGGNGQ